MNIRTYIEKYKIKGLLLLWVDGMQWSIYSTDLRQVLIILCMRRRETDR